MLDLVTGIFDTHSGDFWPSPVGLLGLISGGLGEDMCESQESKTLTSRLGFGDPVEDIGDESEKHGFPT